MTLESHFLKTVDFIKYNDSLINCHLVDFFTENLWDSCLPSELKFYAEEAGHNVLSEIMKFDINDSSGEETKLQAYLKDIASLKLENCDDCVVVRSKLSNVLNYKQETRVSKPLQTEYMKVKKWHEVDIFTKAIAWLTRNESNIVIDAGAGKGYTSVHLAYNYDLPVLAVESSQSNQKSALVYRELVNKRNKSTKPLIHYETEEINEKTDFLQMVEKNFPNMHERKSLIIVALHGCGSLSDSVIKAFLNTQDVKQLCIVPCCYHLSSESLANIYEFPRNSRILAQQSTERTREKMNVLSPLLFYRAVLQVLLQYLGISDYKVGRGAPADNFLTYARWTLNKIEAAKVLSDETIESVYHQHEIFKWKFDFFQLLRIQLAPIVEAAIICDKFVFLQRSKVCKNLEIVQLFDPLVSPRSWAIVAAK